MVPIFTVITREGSKNGGKICPDSAIFHPDYGLINAVKKLISTFLLPLMEQMEAAVPKVKSNM